MKNRLKQAPKFLILLFAVLLYNCEKDDNLIQDEPQLKFAKSTISLDNLKNSKAVKDKLQKMSSKKVNTIANRLVFDETNQLYTIKWQIFIEEFLLM